MARAGAIMKQVNCAAQGQMSQQGCGFLSTGEEIKIPCDQHSRSTRRNTAGGAAISVMRKDVPAPIVLTTEELQVDSPRHEIRALQAKAGADLQRVEPRKLRLNVC